jgi:hypothetical protein
MTTYSPARVLVDMAYDKVAHWVGHDATRQQAQQALDCSTFHTGLSDEIRALVLERFEPEREPVEGQDYLREDFAPWGAC